MRQENQDNFFHYIHDEKESTASRVLKFFLLLAGRKRAMVRDMTGGKIKQKAASIPFYISRKFRVEGNKVAGRWVWTLHPRQSSSPRVIVYLHGGAYIYNIISLHWYLIGQVAKRTGASVIVPDYPLAPRYSCLDTHAFMDVVYQQLLEKHVAKDLLLMGDSAGAGLALAFVQQLRDKKQALPAQVSLISPWLDVSMGHPDLALFEKHDRMLGIKGLQLAGGSYAGELDVKDYRVSPLFGELSGLPEISIFTSTHDILHVDALELRAKLQSEGISHKYYEYPGMVHDWIIFPQLPETGQSIRQLCAILRDGETKPS
jgi:acetyl esterase/lipase